MVTPTLAVFPAMSGLTRKSPLESAPNAVEIEEEVIDGVANGVDIGVGVGVGGGVGVGVGVGVVATGIFAEIVDE